MVELSDNIVDLAIALFIVAFIALLALTSLFRASTTSVPSTIVTLVTLLVGLMFALGIAFLFYKYYIKDQIR